MTQPVYLDYNATAPLRPEATAALKAALSETGNPSSVHSFGRRARRLVEDARDAVAMLVGARPDNVVFTSGGSEANNLALTGLPCASILVSAIEHDSVLQAVPEALRVAVGRNGQIDLEDLERRLAKAEQPSLISVMLANNETGVIQPLQEVVALAGKYDALVHCDAVQAAGKLDIALAELGVAALTLSAHKLGGPRGVGALVLAEDLALAPQIRGGGQERRRRAGTENVAGIAGFGAVAAAVQLATKSGSAWASWRDDLEARLQGLAPDLQVLGAESPRLSNTSCFAVPGLSAESQVMALDLAGFAVSAGSACSSGKVEPSHVLKAMGASPAEAASAIRVSFGWATQPDDLERFADAWAAIYKRQFGAAARAPAA